MTTNIIQGALYDLWYKHYTKANDEDRAELAQEFIDQYTEGYDITTYSVRHPAYYHRESDVKFKKYPVAEILGDFIIRAEDDETKLTVSPQTQANRDNSINEHETPTDFTDRYDDEDEAEDKPRGLYTEFNVYQARGDLYLDFIEEVEPALTVDGFMDMIEKVKANAEEYASTYSEKYHKDYKATLKRIKRLDIEHIAICEECGEVYYKHDMRRKYCDLRPSCKVNAKRRRESERYSDKRSKKVKDRADTLHYIIEGKSSEPIF
ncbi:hypothetical protein ACLIBH_04955 [Virgibacillus sp. W0430]|uniref:hypothetical protein n=1 Tax=Virgibacillus sp. W0430 TaxID=3391580 RepID=UPI003F45145B